MSNEEIRKQVLEYQMKIQKCLDECCSVFELRPEIAEHKKVINMLREQCSHKDENQENFCINGYCYYCGKRME